MSVNDRDPGDGEAGDVYRRIFAQAKTPAEVCHAVARAVRQLRQAMEKEDNPSVTASHVRNLKDIDVERLAAAYARAERSCTYWPTAGEIRELAGCSEEMEATEALQWVFEYLQRHGITGRAWGGGVRFGDDGTGRRAALSIDRMVAAPQIPAAIEGTLQALGGGSRSEGLAYVSRHPRLRGWETLSGDRGNETADRIERQWRRSYRHRSKQQQN